MGRQRIRKRRKHRARVRSSPLSQQQRQITRQRDQHMSAHEVQFCVVHVSCCLSGATGAARAVIVEGTYGKCSNHAALDERHPMGALIVGAGALVAGCSVDSGRGVPG